MAFINVNRVLFVCLLVWQSKIFFQKFASLRLTTLPGIEFSGTMGKLESQAIICAVLKFAALISCFLLPINQLHWPASSARFTPRFRQMLPVESDQYVSFEWIGEQDYLGERISRNSQRTRGANCTSADAIVTFERKDGQRQVVLIEWKYGESYGGTSLKVSKRGTDRTEIYRPLFEREDCPIRKDILPSFDALFYEPFYQFMRQQLLAHEMEKAHELDANIVSVLHIAPAHNADFRRVTSPQLINLGESATSIWTKLVKPEGRFISVSTEQLFGRLSAERFPEIKSWAEYIQARYAWVQA